MKGSPLVGLICPLTGGPFLSLLADMFGFKALFQEAVFKVPGFDTGEDPNYDEPGQVWPWAAGATVLKMIELAMAPGDAKAAHFALMPDGRVAVLGWEWIGVGPATSEVGWYLAVNSQRLARPKEDVMARYRELLEDELDTRVSNPVWERMVSAGLLCGAVMLLWSKALALEDGQPGAAEEWDWWAQHLGKWAKPMPS